MDESGLYKKKDIKSCIWSGLKDFDRWISKQEKCFQVVKGAHVSKYYFLFNNKRASTCVHSETDEANTSLNGLGRVPTKGVLQNVVARDWILST